MIKDQDYLKKIADICLSKSKKLGSTDASILVQSSVSENINVRNKNLPKIPSFSKLWKN